MATPTLHRPALRAFWLALAAALPSAGCGISVGRDLAKIPPGTVIYDDLCGLAPWFEALASDKGRAPERVSSLEMHDGGGEAAVGGRDVFRFEKGPARAELSRLLRANWRRLPESLDRARRIDVELLWARKAATRRAVTTRPATLTVDGRTYALPYQVCLGDFLYGEPLYRLRAEVTAPAK